MGQAGTRNPSGRHQTRSEIFQRRRWQVLEHAMWQWPDLECGKSNAIYYHLGFLYVYIYMTIYFYIGYTAIWDSYWI